MVDILSSMGKFFSMLSYGWLARLAGALPAATTARPMNGQAVAPLLPGGQAICSMQIRCETNHGPGDELLVAHNSPAVHQWTKRGRG